MQNTPIIQLVDVDRVYPDAHAILRASLRVWRGDLVVVESASPAATTTLLRLLAGLVAPSRGMVRHHGWPVEVGPRNTLFARERVAFLPERPSTLPFLTAHEQLVVALMSRGVRADAAARATRALVEADIEHLAGVHVRALNRLDRRRLAVAEALALDPTVVLAADGYGTLLEPLLARRRTSTLTMVVGARSSLPARASLVVTIAAHGIVTVGCPALAPTAPGPRVPGASARRHCLPPGDTAT